MHLSLREEPIGDSALVEDLNGARVQAARARADEILAGAPLDDGNVDSRQCQLGRQYQACRTSSGEYHRMLGHRYPPAGITPVATGASHSSAPTCTASPTTDSTSPCDPYVNNKLIP